MRPVLTDPTNRPPLVEATVMTAVTEPESRPGLSFRTILSAIVAFTVAESPSGIDSGAKPPPL